MSHASVTRRALVAAAGIAGAAGALAGCGARAGTVGSGLAEGSGLPGDGSAAGSEPAPAAERALASMTLEQKVAQLFLVTPEGLTGVSAATVAGDRTAEALAGVPVGGLIYFARNLVSAQQVRDLLAGTDRLCRAAGAGIAPFLSVDEEGGPLVARVARSGLFDVPTLPAMAEIGATGDAGRAAEAGAQIGTYLHDIGFNLDFAPCADVLTNPSNTVIGTRSFGSDPAIVSEMVAAEVASMLETGTLPCAKHFPGHGDTAGDSHTGAVSAARTREEMEACELEPFRAAIDAGCPLVMVGHIETPNFAADGLPASLSPTMMGDVLRGELGFEGVIVSDSFSMGAITQRFTPADAAVRFFRAGGDMLLMPADLTASYQGVLDAVTGGTLDAARIDESALRILRAKERAGLLT